MAEDKQCCCGSKMKERSENKPFPQNEDNWIIHESNG